MATTKSKEKYIEAVGRRKTAVARVRLTPASKSDIKVNGKKIADVFPLESLRKTVHEPLETSSLEGKFSISAKVYGGGTTSQAEAVRLGISRALVEYNSELRSPLKQKGFLKRDPRVKERKKFGKRKARKSPQWSKR